MLTPFYLALHVHVLDAARGFYGKALGCREGRSAPTWVDFFGHQLSLHLGQPFGTAATGRVGDHLVPMPHFGVVLHLPDWQELATRLQTAGTLFDLAPSLRFQGQPGAQATMFLRGPSGNPLEFKGFASLDAVFAA